MNFALAKRRKTCVDRGQCQDWGQARPPSLMMRICRTPAGEIPTTWRTAMPPGTPEMEANAWDALNLGEHPKWPLEVLTPMESTS